MKKIIIVSGDPNSINSELIYKSLKQINNKIKKKIYIISNYNLLISQLKKLKMNLNFQIVKDLKEKSEMDKIKVIDVNVKFTNPFNVKKNQASRYVIKCLNMAHRFALNENAVGLINCPINKTLLKKKIGVTEYLANKSKIKENTVAMLINNQKLSVCPITTHTDLKDVASKLNKKEIVDKVITIQKWFKRRIKKKPRIAILGLNPHNAELRKNSEEKKIIIPAITKLKRLGFLVTGPMVADTLFIEEYKKFDVIIGMFHDQVLAPFKTLFKFKAINITLGLNYLRVSPDHGVAKNLILKKKANAESLTRCIDFMDKFK